jgi:hypothetical protein
MKRPLFYDICLEELKFLEEEYGLDTVKYQRLGGEESVFFRNDLVGVKVINDARNDQIYILLMRLQKGKQPPYPLFITNSTKLDLFYLNDLINLRAGQAPEYKVIRGDRKELERIMKKVTTDLKKYGGDVLMGNFVVFRQLERVVKKRAKV